MDGTIGEIRLFAGNFAPRGWAFCEGQLIAVSTNSALFSILGTQYGGDGRTSFGLPDLRGRAALGAGHGPGLSNYLQGAHGGRAQNQLTVAHLPTHTHPASFVLRANNLPATTTDPTNAVNAGEQGGFAYDNRNTDINVDMRGDAIEVAGNQTGSSGGGSPVDNYQPSLGLHFIICIYGTYPRRS